MPLTRSVSGRLREVWYESDPQDGGTTVVVQTQIRVQTATLGHVFGILGVTATTGSPVLTTASAVVNGYLQVTVANTASAGNTATWTLDVWRVHSVQQATDQSTQPAIHVAGGTSGGGSGPSGVANWDSTFVRYIILDGDNGNDSHVGYIDAPPGTVFTPLQTAAVAVKTTHRINELRPPVGAGRKVVVLAKPRAGNARYDNLLPGDGLGADDASQRSGYALMVFRGSDLTNSVADRSQLGFTTAIPGPNTDGSFTVQSVTPGSAGIAVKLTGATLPAGWTLGRYRLRSVAAGTGVVSYSSIVWGDPAAVPDASVVLAPHWTGLPTAPGDKVWIERPGVVLHDSLVAADAVASIDGRPPLRHYGFSVEAGILSPVSNGPGSYAQYSGVWVDETQGGNFNFGAAGGFALLMHEVVFDETGAVILTSNPGVHGPCSCLVGTALLESVELSCCHFATDATATDNGTNVWAKHISINRSVFQSLLTGQAVSDTQVGSVWTGAIKLSGEGHAVVADVSLAPTWYPAPITLEAPVVNSRGWSVELNDAHAFWGAEPQTPGYILKAGIYNVRWNNFDLPQPGNGVLVYWDPYDVINVPQTLISYASLAITGFELDGGQKIEVRKPSVPYYGGSLPCPRGTLMRMVAFGSGGTETPAGLIVTAADSPASTRFKLASALAGQPSPLGVLLCNTVQPGTEVAGGGYAVVSSDEYLVLQVQAGDTPPAPGALLYLSSSTPGYATVTETTTVAWKVALTLPDGPGTVGGAFLVPQFVRWDPDLVPVNLE